jgi:serine/threonine protein kinase/Flp pilus assembly protein TadD
MGISCPNCQFENPDDTLFCGRCGTQFPSPEDLKVTATLETPKEELPRGTKLADRYEIIEVLGRGGMGRVYRVEDTKIKQDIALKVIKPGIAADKKTIERFQNELKTTRMISHRNVCRMFDLGEAEGKHFITMEYIPGEDLRSFIRRVGQLPSGKAISIAKQVCEGLTEAHRLRVVHRDLKSSNIMIDKDGNARVMDFGIARSHTTKSLTGEGIIIGTPEYMSPEQAEAKEVDRRSDIYSLGVILYEMVTGKLPFEGDTPLSIAMKHKGEIPISPRELNPQIPPDLNDIILKCLEKEKERRFQTAEELYADLDILEKELPSTEKVVPQRKPLTSREITVTFRLKKLLIPASVFIAMIAAALLIWRLLPQRGVAPAPKIENSIAVISFKNQTGDRAYDYLKEAIPSLLITNLENTGNLHVVTWERMQDLLEQIGRGDVEVIDEDLGFELCQREGIVAIAVGSFIKAGDMFATNVKVLNTENKRTLKSASARGEGIDSILRTQIDDLSREISEGIGVSERMVEASQIRIAEFTTDSMEAYSHFLKGREDLSKMYFDDARQSLEKAVILDPEFAYAHLLLGRAYRSLRLTEARNAAYEKAKTHAERATKKERLAIEAHYARAIDKDTEKSLRILKQMAEEYPKEKHVHLDLGSIYWSRKHYDNAIEEFNQALKLDPNNGDALNSLAFVYVEMEDYEKAIESFKRYVSVSPGDANPLDSMGYCYFSMGRFDEAVAKFKEALDLKPDWSHAYWAISYIHALREDYPEAKKWIDRAIATAPSPSERSEGLLFKGLYDFWLGRMEQSLREIRSASVLAESIGNMRIKSCADEAAVFVHYDRGEHKLARKSLQEFLDASKNIFSLTTYQAIENETLGYADLTEGKTDSANARLAELKSLLPELAPYPNTKAALQVSYDQLHAEVSLAEGSLEEAVAVGKTLSVKKFGGGIRVWMVIDINLPVFHDVLARGHRQRGELDRAIAEYERLLALKKASENRCLIHPRFHYRVARLYEEKGWNGKAIEHYERFLDLWKDADPGIADVEDARKKLAGLKEGTSIRE